MKPNGNNELVFTENVELAKLNIKLIATPNRLVGDGKNTSKLEATVTGENDAPIAGIEVVFSSLNGDFIDNMGNKNGKRPLSAITDVNGKAQVTYLTDDISGVSKVNTIVVAKVDDIKKDLHSKTELNIIFEPGSAKGVIRDSETNKPVKGAKITISKTFDNGETFTETYITSDDGMYEIFVPKGNLTYNMLITIINVINNKNEEIVYKQKVDVGTINGQSKSSSDSLKTIAGLALIKNTDKSSSKIDGNNNFRVRLVDKNGASKDVSIINGVFMADNINKNEEYKIQVVYDFQNGKKIIVGEKKVTISSDGELNLSEILIDPYGIVKDAATGKPIDGVITKLYYADTKRNVDSGKIPNTLVKLPIINKFEPNNNENPQNTNVNGEYAFMVFQETDYYIVGTKNGYDTHTSSTISVYDSIVNYNFSMNVTKSNGGSNGGSNGTGDSDKNTVIKSKVGRIGGKDRIDTSIEIARKTYQGKIKNVILATAYNFPDALTGSVLAYDKDAPILLVGTTEEEENRVLNFIIEKMDKEGKVFLLGGTGVVTEEMSSKIKASGFLNITRLGGKDRYETALKIAEYLNVKEGTPIIIASGENYPDALSVSSIAAVKKYPILLVKNNEIIEEVIKKIKEVAPANIYIIGEKGVISKSVEDKINKEKFSSIRIGGSDRYETSAEIAKYFSSKALNTCITTGLNFPDAIAGSLYAAKNDASILLVNTVITDSVKAYLKNSIKNNVTIFGGVGAVSREIEDELNSIVK